MGKRSGDSTARQSGSNKARKVDDSASPRPDNGPGWHSTHVTKDNCKNDKFEAYYRGTIIPEEEWDEYLESLRRNLPISFRLSSINGLHEKIAKTLQDTCFNISKTPVEHEVDGEIVTVQPPSVLSWYSPLGHAYQLAIGKKHLKKIAALKEFRQFLIREDKQGNITRQEAVSMIPPQLLDVQPHHIVLDMCAAPGSKTAQLLEALHSDGPNKVPSGLIIANDSDHKRAYMLVHQLKRLGSPSFLVTTHQGQFYPNLYLPKNSRHASKELAYVSLDTPNGDGTVSKTLSPAALNNTSTVTPDAQSNVEVSPLLFDRILCDVPCSGDGTMRKNPSIWRQWNIGGGMGLHSLQLAIAWRSAQMLKIGGRMVYSTCSLNPLENEAVVAELVRRSRGALRIVDVSDKLPGLIRTNGLHSWDVLIEHTAGARAQSGETTTETPVEAEKTQESTRLKLFNLKAINDVNCLPEVKRARLRTSFFSPSTLQSMKDELNNAASAPVTEEEGASGKKRDDFFSIKSSVFNYLPTAEEMHLDRCVRILPHKQDTGGFFITLLEKVDVLPTWDGFFNTEKTTEVVSETPSTPVVEESSALDEESPKMGDDEQSTSEESKVTDVVVREKKTFANKSTKNLPYQEKPQQKKWNDFPFVNLQTKYCDLLQSEFGLDASKGYNARNLFNRSDNLAGNSKKIYYLSDTIAELVNTPHNFRLKIVHSGLKIFEVTANATNKAYKRGVGSVEVEEEEDKPSYRIAQDALNFVVPFLTKQIVNVKVEDLCALLRSIKYGVKFEDLSENTREILEFVPEKETEESMNARRAAGKPIISLGSCVVQVLPEDLPEDIAQVATQLMCAAWRSHASISLMLAEPERNSLLYLLDPQSRGDDAEDGF